MSYLILKRFAVIVRAFVLSVPSPFSFLALPSFRKVVECEAFLSLSLDCMEQIIANDELNVSSEDVSTTRAFPRSNV